MRGATAKAGYQQEFIIFQSTLPMRGATEDKPSVPAAARISIHAPHAGSDDGLDNYRTYCRISIHAPHAGSDAAPAAHPLPVVISIHAPHAGSDLAENVVRGMTEFQSTLPMRGATVKQKTLNPCGIQHIIL